MIATRPLAALRECWPLWLGCAAVLLIALHYNVAKSIWIDETYSLDTAGRELVDTMRQALHFELQPPLYFLLLHVWLKLHASIEFARLLSTLFVLATVWVLDRTSRLLGLSDRAALLPLLAGLCPALLWAASEARGYALTLLLASCTTYFFARVWVIGTTRPIRDCSLYVTFAALSLLTFYYSGFLLAAHFLGGLLCRGRRQSLMLSFAALTLVILPWLSIVQSQSAEHPSYLPPLDLGTGSWWAAWSAVAAWSVGAVVDSLFQAVPFLARGGVSGVLAILLCAIVLARLWRGEGRWSRAETLFAIQVALPFAALVLLRVSNVSIVEQRHLTLLAIPLLIFVCLLISRIAWSGSRWLLGTTITAFFALAALSYSRNYQGPHDWRSAVDFIMKHERAGEPILFFDSNGVLPFRYYYRGPNRLYGIPADPSFERYAVEDWVVSDAAQLHERFAATAASAQSFWLVQHGWHDRLGGALVDGFFQERADVLDARTFHGLRVAHLRRLAQARSGETRALFPTVRK